ncbi:MAG: hypothetical protein SGJ21_15755 [Alphaproteobacteria bacterium]|nr:hypothetical protein [Alphaproteobacteria bacterium]MDZ4762518.1 hypothetical protein [Alphaproteobacteria bacterium]
MRIGIDFDNTIANYDGVFHAAALARGLISADLPNGKNDVRDYLNGSGRKDDFTELQGYVYGSRMDLVSPYPGVRNFIVEAVARGHEVWVISHKTRTPMLGPAFDMHEAARGFLNDQNMIDPARAYFEVTKEDKLRRATGLAVDVFIDDLPEILEHPAFPDFAKPVLFDPDNRWSGSPFERHGDWTSIHRHLLG